MRLVEATTEDVTFIYSCLQQLSGDVEFPEEDLKEFLISQRYFNSTSTSSEILVGWEDDIPRGILTCNRFNIPRYLGQGVELEEVIVASDAHGMGFGSAMVENFLRRARNDPLIRKIIVKTDDLKIAGAVYKKYFDTTDITVFSRRVNDL